MKIVLFSGSHPRHLFLNREILKYFEESLIFVMEREAVIPVTPKNLTEHDSFLFDKHFKERAEVESKIYGDLESDKVFINHKVINISSKELNSPKVADIIKDYKPDFCFIFGVDLILTPTIDSLPKDKVNLHLGISPWYKGGATLFWPFYHFLWNILI